MNTIRGTGDGGVMQSKKIFGFILLVLGVLADVSLTTHMQTPPEIAIASLWIIGCGGLFTMGGQSLVDMVAKWKLPVQAGSTQSIREKERIVKTSEPK